MAEALGLGASVIAIVDIATKTGSAYLKIQKLWREVRNVPVMLREKAEDIQISGELVANIEANLAKSLLLGLASDHALLEKIIRRCHSALNELKHEVDQIHTRLMSKQGLKHKITSAKAALKKEDLEGLSVTFDRALRLLQMAQVEAQLRIIAINWNAIPPASIKGQADSTRSWTSMTNKKTREAVKRDTHDNDRVPKEGKKISKISCHSPIIKRFRKFSFDFGQTGGFHPTMTAFGWLNWSVYSIIAKRANMGWQINLRAHDVVRGFDEDFWGLMKQDDYHGFLRYMDDRRMSLFVRSASGRDILSIAVAFGSANITKALIKQGLKIDSGDYIARWYITEAIGRLWYYDSNSAGFNSHMMDMLSENGLGDVLDGADGLLMSLAHGITLRGFEALLSQCAPNRDLTFAERSRLLRTMAYRTIRGDWTLDQVFGLLPEAMVRNKTWLVQSRSQGEYSVLHSLAVAAMNSSMGLSNPTEKHRWAQLLTDCIKLDPLGLQHADAGPPFKLPGWSRHIKLTPFSAIFYGVCVQQLVSDRQHVDIFDQMNEILRFWVGILASAGVNLLEFGRMEKRFHKTAEAPRLPEFFAKTPFAKSSDGGLLVEKGGCRYLVAGVTYGRLPEHWKVWVTRENHEYAGDFWGMIEDQTRSIPGSWPLEPEDHGMTIWDWMQRERHPLLWSEYQRNRIPS
ncbi:Ankyrin repeat-containing protein [Colletotrichum chrysophilum]|uniref:Ankyrin repeat-containing protein n=1 Tax=Colletotrichum chrysophilum TaxID=1836956 RepID=A0AAD9AM02_9PEZI|nr:Ankyrin repeat-containing protein [Colletotrichum chrysophilum]